MKLILLTNEEFFVEEDQIISLLFEEGLDVLHLRKPGSDPVYSERLLTLLPDEYHKQIVVHDHFYLKKEFNLMGIHLNSRNPEPPAGNKGHVSKSLHSLEEVTAEKKKFDYVFLSPIFDSISKSGYPSAFDRTLLESAHKSGVIDHRVMALGGVSLQNIPIIKDCGFGGVVIKGDLWNRFDIHSNKDFKSLLDHFKMLRKAVG
jgi:thiamine-phosphate pyrophosphorylase